jgi:DNA-binding SARP family transcriptional activator
VIASVPDPAQLLVLGSFDLVFDEEHPHLSEPAQRLLAHLATTHRARPARRGALAERLWPQAPPDRATSNLRSLLWRLPRPRGRQLVTSDATTVRLASDVKVDLWAAEKLATLLCSDETPSPEALADLSPLQEDLLPDWHDEWLVAERESHRQKRLHALERSSAHLRAAGRFNGALSAALCAVTSEPLRESAHRRVIEVHLAEDNHSEALRQFHGYRALLSRELGLAPSPTIRRLVAPLVGRPDDL